MTCVENPELNDAEIARRRDDVIRRMANAPPKPHSAMKIGKRKAKVGAKAGRPGEGAPGRRKNHGDDR